MSPEDSAASARGANPQQMATTHPQRDSMFSIPLAPDSNRQVPSREHAFDRVQ